MTQAIKIGMKLSDLTDEIFQEIVLLYDQAVGGQGKRHLKPNSGQTTKNKLEHHVNAIECRFGSKLTPHSKLWILRKNISEHIIYFRFSANLDHNDPDLTNKETIAEQLSREFYDRIATFLQEKNLAIEF